MICSGGLKAEILDIVEDMHDALTQLRAAMNRVDNQRLHNPHGYAQSSMDDLGRLILQLQNKAEEMPDDV